jgi:hypothetical protein
MRSADLLHEYLAAMRVMTLDDARAIPIKACAMVCPAPTCIRLVGGSLARYEPNPGGVVVAHVFPVTTVDPDNPELIESERPDCIVSHGHVIDLCAVHPRTPQYWALRTGAATVLGAIEPQGMFCSPVPVYRTPVAWLRAGCRGIVLLTPNALERARILRQIGVLQAEDERHEGELVRLLSLPTPRHTSVIVR